MKNIFKIVFISILLFGCNNDDDSNNNDDNENPVTVDDGFLRPEITKSFLLGEKWYLHEVSNADTNEDLLPLALDCELDSFYVFEQTNEDNVNLNQGDTECDDVFDRYQASIYSYRITDANSITIDTQAGVLLGGFANPSNFSSVEFLLANDSSSKIFKGNVSAESEGTRININYSLIAYPTDRP